MKGKKRKFDFLSEIGFIKFATEMGENGVDYCVDWESYFASIGKKRRS